MDIKQCLSIVEKQKNRHMYIKKIYIDLHIIDKKYVYIDKLGTVYAWR